MGKKSRRPNRNKPKEIPAAASTAVAAPRQVITSIADDIATFNQLVISRDWEGALEVESEVSAIANRSENKDPILAACSVYLMLGGAHRFLGREGGIEEATLYYKKTVELAKKAGDNEILTDGVLNIAKCSVMMGRVDEAMDLHKSRCDEIGKESMNADIILQFTKILEDYQENSRALVVVVVVVVKRRVDIF